MVFSSLFLICCCAFGAWNTQAKDLGTHGHTYEIAEQDLLEQIETKLQSMGASYELKAHNKKIISRTKSKIETPNSIAGIKNTTEPRTFYYDPTYVVAKDIRDHLGNIIASRGSRINPLDKVSLSQNLIFINGMGEEQIEWAKQRPGKLILVSGSPIQLSTDLARSIYFDQAGVLVKKLGIVQVPALVTQEGKKLKIEEIKLEESDYDK